MAEFNFECVLNETHSRFYFLLKTVADWHNDKIHSKYCSNRVIKGELPFQLSFIYYKEKRSMIFLSMFDIIFCLWKKRGRDDHQCNVRPNSLSFFFFSFSFCFFFFFFFFPITYSRVGQEFACEEGNTNLKPTEWIWVFLAEIIDSKANFDFFSRSFVNRGFKAVPNRYFPNKVNRSSWLLLFTYVNGCQDMN